MKEVKKISKSAERVLNYMFPGKGFEYPGIWFH